MFVNAPSRRRPFPAYPGTDPEKTYDYKEFLDNLYGCLSNLPQRAAAVFISREIDGLSTEEICELFSISKFNCWTILHRARSRLRRHLEYYGFKPSI
jgi:RNA polymerase sigma-70 factor (ECF subfamily)